ncbi:MAG: hypothetical protein MI741_05940, partial [Rhodospirillales bacterium]|nr:hypothetical protein [Rhodospirillales bacterium]
MARAASESLNESSLESVVFPLATCPSPARLQRAIRRIPKPSRLGQGAGVHMAIRKVQIEFFFR